MGGVLFIDEAYYLYRPENERDYGQEAIEILLQVMENQRDDLVVILAGYKDRMDTFFQSNPGMSLAHRAPPRLPRLQRPTSCCDRASMMLRAAELPLRRRRARGASRLHRARACAQPHFANARAMRNALDRARLRQASRLFAERGSASSTRDDLHDAHRGRHPRQSRVFARAPPTRRDSKDHAMHASDAPRCRSS